MKDSKIKPGEFYKSLHHGHVWEILEVGMERFKVRLVESNNHDVFKEGEIRSFPIHDSLYRAHESSWKRVYPKSDLFKTFFDRIK